MFKVSSSARLEARVSISNLSFSDSSSFLPARLAFNVSSSDCLLEINLSIFLVVKFLSIRELSNVVRPPPTPIPVKAPAVSPNIPPPAVPNTVGNVFKSVRAEAFTVPSGVVKNPSIFSAVGLSFSNRLISASLAVILAVSELNELNCSSIFLEASFVLSMRVARENRLARLSSSTLRLPSLPTTVLASVALMNSLSYFGSSFNSSLAFAFSSSGASLELAKSFKFCSRLWTF